MKCIFDTKATDVKKCRSDRLSPLLTFLNDFWHLGKSSLNSQNLRKLPLSSTPFVWLPFLCQLACCKFWLWSFSPSGPMDSFFPENHRMPLGLGTSPGHLLFMLQADQRGTGPRDSLLPSLPRWSTLARSYWGRYYFSCHSSCPSRMQEFLREETLSSWFTISGTWHSAWHIISA